MSNKKDISPDQPLTAKQKMFADLYLASGAIYQSAVKAGYSEKTAAVTGNENLKKANVAKYVSERQVKAQNKLEISKEAWLSELVQRANSHIGDIYKIDENGDVSMRDDLTDESLKNVKKITQTVTTTREGVQYKTTTVEMYDRHKPIETLGKALGFIDSNKAQGTPTQNNNFFTELNQYIINNQNGLQRKNLPSKDSKP